MASYTPKDLKEAVSDFNKAIPEMKIAVVAKSIANIEKSFKEAILKCIEEEKTDSLPESVVDFYNDHIATDEEEGKEEEKKPTAKPKAKPKAKAKVTGKPTGKTTVKPNVKAKVTGKPSTTTTDAKKTGKKDGKAKARTRDGNGLVAKAVEAYQTKGIRTTKELTAHLTPMFPDRPISSTVSHVCCILAHVKDI